jgi:hypothetical protein
MIPALLIILNIIGWHWLYQHKNQIEGVAITTFQHTQLEIVHAVARSVSSYVAHEIVRKEQPAISEIEQEVFKRFVEPILILDNGDAWYMLPIMLCLISALIFLTYTGERAWQRYLRYRPKKELPIMRR